MPKKQRPKGAIVIASPWSPPARMKSNNNLVGGSLITDMYYDYSFCLNDFAEYMEGNNAELYAISIQNEPDIKMDYESCDWTAIQVKDLYGIMDRIVQV